MKEIKQALQNIDKDKYVVLASEQKNKLSFTIQKKFICCDICNGTRHYKTLRVRQDSRVKFFMIERNVCRKCIDDVDLLLNNLKESVKSPLETGKW